MPNSSERRDTIYIDASPLGDPWLTGIGRYTARLAIALAPYVNVGFFAESLQLPVPEGLDWSHDQDLQRWARRIWQGRRTVYDNKMQKSSCVYTCLRPAERRFATELSILHDYTPLIVPHTHTSGTRGLFQGFFAKTLLSSDWALAVSHSTKHDASWLCDFPQERIVVCHSGPSLCVERHLDAAPAERRKNVALVVATLEPRKNADFLLDWFRDSTALPDGFELWWVGRVGWLSSRRRYRQYLKVKGRRLRFLGTVPDAKLCRLYRSADVSIYPSLYEGFGFPALDSLRHGTPVLMGYHSSLREFEHLAGVFYFDPCDPGTLDAAWRRFANERQSTPALGVLDAQYNWAHVARAVVEMTRRVRTPHNLDCAA